MTTELNELLETERLILRPLDAADAPFILRLVNEPAFVRFIGDRGVRTLADAEVYIANGTQQNLREFGFGLLLVEVKPDDMPIGMCGLMLKPWLACPDIAYAFVPEARGKGYAVEAARAVLDFGRSQLNLDRIVAVVTPDNAASIRLLEKLGFHADRRLADPMTAAELELYESVLPQSAT